MHTHSRRPRLLLVAAVLLMLAGALWLATALDSGSASTPVAGSVTPLDDPAIDYGPGWRVSAQGADPAEPADPWRMPSGVFTLTTSEREVALNLAQGDYWGYLYVTVDGAPANRLAYIHGNTNSLGEPAGYVTLHAPERQTADGPSPRWMVVHRAAQSGPPQQVRVEVWRGWGQTPVRGVVVDALPAPPRPAWPGVLLMGLGVTALAWRGVPIPRPRWLRTLLDALIRPIARQSVGDGVALVGGLLIAAAMGTRIWWLGPLGLALLGYAALASPLRWAAALLVGLPFYFSVTIPILPGRATNLVDIGVWGGLAISLGYWLRSGRAISWSRPLLLLAALTVWALVAASAAAYTDLALREWRTVFMAALGFGVLLTVCRDADPAPRRVALLVGAWLAGTLLMAGIGIAQAVGGFGLIEAEGVQRVRGLYGSPNNLALYLERALFVPLAGVLLLPAGRLRWTLLAVSALLGAALLLTFSKGALLLGLPAGLATLWLGGVWVLRKQGRSTRGLWWLAAAGVAVVLAMLPFLGTERFQRLFDFERGTGMIRLLLWRSSWHMALDHPWLGVGPDNFLYAYRSGYLLPAAWQEPNLNHPHNLVLDWWTRLGLPGLVLGLSWMVAGVWGLARRVWGLPVAKADGLGATPPEGGYAGSWLWLGLLAGVAAALAHGLIDLSYAVPDLLLLWVLLFTLPTLGKRIPSPAGSILKRAPIH